MKRGRSSRYLGQHIETVEYNGRLLDISMAVYSPQFRAKRLPIPPPPPYPPEKQDLVRRAAEGRL
jgi:hypothetical protein